LTLNKYMAMGPSGARCQEWPCWLVAGSKLLPCSALQVSSGQLQVVASRSREPVSQGHEAVMERCCEDSAVKC
jgi:hypothetical protein